MNFGFLSKNGRFVTHNSFSKKKVAETPIFIVFFGCTLLGQGVKKGKFSKHIKKRKNLTDNWKALFFWYFRCFCWASFFLFFFVFFVFFVSFVFFCFFVFFFGGFKGQVRWPEGSPHLALKPSLFLFLFFFGFFFFFFLFFFCFFVFFGGFKGQVARRATSLGPKPSLLVFVVFLFCFLFFVFCLVFLVFFIQTKTLFFPQKRAFFVYFQCFSFFLL